MLHSLVAPSITQSPPHSEVAISGSSVRLTCQGVSIPPPRVHWTKDNATVQRGLVNTSGDSVVTSHLTIPDVMYKDRGEYACVFSNYRGNVSSSVRLDVHGKTCREYAVIFILIILEGRSARYLDLALTRSCAGQLYWEFRHRENLSLASLYLVIVRRRDH